jgi:hypothetical protein
MALFWRFIPYIKKIYIIAINFIFSKIIGQTADFLNFLMISYIIHVMNIIEWQEQQSRPKHFFKILVFESFSILSEHFTRKLNVDIHIHI